MNEITAITPQVKDKTRCNIYIDNRFCCGLGLETVVTHRLKVGQIVTQEALEEMQFDSEKNKALDKAMLHLSATRKTEKQMRDFLAKKGYLPNVCEYVMAKLRSHGLLNDGEYAEAYIEYAAKKKGGKKIRMELRGRGLLDEDIDNALSGVSKEDELSAAKAILEKYLRGKSLEKETLQKAYRYLLGKGFDYELCKEAIGEISEGQVCDE